MDSKVKAQRELTFGEKSVGLTFNPSGNEKVNKLKQLFAEAFVLVNDDKDNPDFGMELNKLAINQAVLAQMAAVKAVTWNS